MDKEKVIHGLSLVLSYLAAKPGSFWYAIGLTIGSAIAASTVLEVLTRRYVKKWDIKMGQRLIATLLGFLSFLSSSADALITNAPFFATPVLQRFAWIVTLAVAYHHFIGNKLAQKVVQAAGKWSGAKPPGLPEQPSFTVIEPEKKPIPAVNQDIWR